MVNAGDVLEHKRLGAISASYRTGDLGKTKAVVEVSGLNLLP